MMLRRWTDEQLDQLAANVQLLSTAQLKLVGTFDTLAQKLANLIQQVGQIELQQQTLSASQDSTSETLISLFALVEQLGQTQADLNESLMQTNAIVATTQAATATPLRNGNHAANGQPSLETTYQLISDPVSLPPSTWD